MILRILVGLCGLGVVVFVHELGHFLAARLVGIDVEAFSLGWGPPVFRRKTARTEYRICIFPVGGYCLMRGETEFRAALAARSAAIPREPGTFYGSPPWRRIVVAAAGPLANALLAVVILAGVWGIGFEVRTLGNRIVLASEIDASGSAPADAAGLATGDFITAIDGQPVSNYQDIQERIAPYPGVELKLTAERDGRSFDALVTPRLDPATGAGRIGVYFWTDPVVETVLPGSSAALAGVKPGDRLLSANGRPVPHTVALSALLQDRPNELRLVLDRGGRTVEADLLLSYDDAGAVQTGLEFAALRFRTPRLTPLAALKKGAQETWETFAVSVLSLGTLFRGVDLTKAVSGPVRISYMVGEVAADGFAAGFGAGLSALANFLALLSVALGLMNLLPIPALDGGMIVLFSVEAFTRRPLNPRLIYGFQFVGALIVVGLLLFSLFGDILFLFGK